MFGHFCYGEKGGISARILAILAGVLIIVIIAGQLLGWWGALFGGTRDVTGLPASNLDQIAAVSDQLNNNEEPLTQYTYLLEAGDQVYGYFNECYGIGLENEVAEQKIVDAQGKEIIKKSPGVVHWSNVTLRRGISGDLGIWNWRQQVVEGNMNLARQDIRITLLDSTFQPAAIWEFVNA